MAEDLKMVGNDYNLALFVFFIPVRHVGTMSCNTRAAPVELMVEISTYYLKCRPTLSSSEFHHRCGSGLSPSYGVGRSPPTQTRWPNTYS